MFILKSKKCFIKFFYIRSSIWKRASVLSRYSAKVIPLLKNLILLHFCNNVRFVQLFSTFFSHTIYYRSYAISFDRDNFFVLGKIFPTIAFTKNNFIFALKLVSANCSKGISLKFFICRFFFFWSIKMSLCKIPNC